jgi:uncharacterized membrane protein (UPF0127 family)
MLLRASKTIDAGILSYLRVLPVILFILLPIAEASADGAMPTTDYEITQIRLTPADGGASITFTVKLAKTPKQHAYGLMYSPPLPAKFGMLFLFKDMKPRSFWMKNTPITLDMLFFDADGGLVKLIPNATPNSLLLRHSGVAAKYVLEIAGGEAARLNLVMGTRLHVPITKHVNSVQSNKK